MIALILYGEYSPSRSFFDFFFLSLFCFVFSQRVKAQNKPQHNTTQHKTSTETTHLQNIAAHTLLRMAGSENEGQTAPFELVVAQLPPLRVNLNVPISVTVKPQRIQSSPPDYVCFSIFLRKSFVLSRNSSIEVILHHGQEQVCKGILVGPSQRNLFFSHKVKPSTTEDLHFAIILLLTPGSPAPCKSKFADPRFSQLLLELDSQQEHSEELIAELFRLLASKSSDMGSRSSEVLLREAKEKVEQLTFIRESPNGIKILTRLVRINSDSGSNILDYIQIQLLDPLHNSEERRLMSHQLKEIRQHTIEEECNIFRASFERQLRACSEELIGFIIPKDVAEKLQLAERLLSQLQRTISSQLDLLNRHPHRNIILDSESWYRSASNYVENVVCRIQQNLTDPVTERHGADVYGERRRLNKKAEEVLNMLNKSLKDGAV